jgi:medium-chain acyl-[acyl-carrier-protein] hydrolase
MNMKLLCLGPAGAGASLFSSWRDLGKLDLVPVCLPGREDRFLDEPLSGIELIAEWVIERCIGGTEPYAMFGQCMGALVAYEILRSLQRRGGRLPEIVFLSGHRAPHLPQIEPRIAHLEDADFLENVRTLGGTPEECFENEELLELIMPALRADFTACDEYVFQPGDPLRVPLVVLGGDEDPYVSREALEAWRAYTTSFCKLELFPGDHFFYLRDSLSLVRTMERHLASLEPSRVASKKRLENTCERHPNVRIG